MDKPEAVQTKKGIWVLRDADPPLCYSTCLREKKEDVVGFIPFEHPYEPRYLGSVAFLDISQFPHLFSRCGFEKGLLQNHFYPLGGNPMEDKPELVGKGLARRIDFEVAQDLSRKFPADTLIAIGACQDLHLAYCERVGLVPFKAILLEEYVKVLSR